MTTLTTPRGRWYLAGMLALVILIAGVLLLGRQQLNKGGAKGLVGVACSGDVTSALQNAVNGGGTVSIGAGTCSLSGRIAVKVAGTTIDGAGMTSTHLIQHARTNILQVTADGVVIENLDVNTAQFNPGVPPVKKNPVPATIFSNGNNETLLNVSSEAGTGFGMRFVGPSPCASDQRGGLVATNVVSTNTGQGGFTAFDVDCQNKATLSNLTISGNYVALFQDANVTINGEQYTPGAKPCQFAVYLTAPSSNIHIDSVSGGGGVKIAGTPNVNVTTTNISKAPGC